MQDVVRKEILKLLDAGMRYVVFYSEWFTPTQVVAKKGAISVVKDERNELLGTKLVTD